MALNDEMIGLLNPWWTDSHWRETDPHLQALARSEVVLPAPGFVEGLEVGDRSTHVVRGPRQVGKSTGLKLLVRRLLDNGTDPRRVAYLNLDLLEDQPIQEVAASVVRAKQLAATGDESCVLMLDEVTTVPKWARAVKAVWDAGVTRRDTVVCTGSSAVDLAEQELEALPGRRRTGLDHLLLPQSFASFARAVDSRIPPSPESTIAEMLGAEERTLLERHRAFVPVFNDILERYLVFGGLPAAIVEAAEGARDPSREVKRVIWDSVSREVRKRGASEPALRALLERVIRSLGSKTSWPTVARELDMALGGRKVPPDARSVRSYVEFLGLCYELMTLYFWKTGSGTNDLSRDKKLYFGDPLLQTVVLDHTPGLDLDRAATVENVLALALYRRYESVERQADGFTAPDELHVYETSAPREIDFVCRQRRDAELVEVKFQRNVSLAATQTMRRAFPSRTGIVASIDSFELGDQFAVIPASLALWALG
ncbi:MAG TPA: ATP-binding protein [Gaiellaceae bacterium]